MRDETRPPEDSRRTSRRRFAKTVATVLVAAPLAARIAHAQTPPSTREPIAPPKPEPSPSPQRPAPQQPSPLGEAYGEVARVRFGDKLSPEELTRVKRAMEGKVRTADRLRAFKLQNSDEPDFVFSA
ncbi:MAG: hypothetical protein QOE33_1072 [Acidobacteriota bacterium]|nr:hypothetical protein [Acidobacteriota bacterium]